MGAILPILCPSKMNAQVWKAKKSCFGSYRWNRLFRVLLLWCSGVLEMVSAECEPPSQQCLHGDEGPGVWTFKEIDFAAIDVIHQVVQAQGLGGNQPQAGEAQGYDQIVPGGDQVANEHNLDILIQLAGERNLLVFRSNPFDLMRPESHHIHMRPEDTIEDVEWQLTIQWPDLQQIDWEIVPIDSHVYSSLEVFQGDYCVLVWSSRDLFAMAGSGIILVEIQKWDIIGERVTTSLAPKTIWKDSSIPNFLETIAEARICANGPCPIFVDGNLVLSGDRLNLHDADFVVITQTKDIENTRVVVYDPRQQLLPLLEQTPTDFEERVRQMSEVRGFARSEDRALAAWRFSWAMTCYARRIYDTKNMKAIPVVDLYVFPCVHGNARFLQLAHAAHRDPFGLVYSLMEEGVVSADAEWQFMPVHTSILSSGLSGFGYVVGILEETGRGSAREAFILLERAIVSRKPPHQTFRNYMTLWTYKDFELRDFVQRHGMNAFCEIHDCIAHVNGNRIAPGLHLDIDDGAFIQLSIQLRLEQGEVRQEDQMVDDTEQSKGEEPEPKRPRQMSQMNASSSTPTSLAEHPPTGTTMLCVWLVWKGIDILTRMSQHARLSSAVVRSISCTVRGGSVRFRLWILLSMILIESGGGLQFSLGGTRIGEASHPGPDSDTSLVWLGTSNPSGIRGKEWLYGDLPYGIWNVSETHLSEAGQRYTRGAIRQINREQGRNLQLLCGAPAPLRARSAEAGTWTGVAVITDLIPKPITVFWPHQEYDLCRVQLYQVWHGPVPLTGANVYLWPVSPTWPKGKEASRELLTTLTKELVISRTGPRFICGDMNMDLTNSELAEVWRRHGWVEAQRWAKELLGWDPIPTCKHSTTVDYIWISPEVIPWVTGMKSWDLFSDHTTIALQLNIPTVDRQQQVWTQPAYIPWQLVDKHQWQQQAFGVPEAQGTITENYENFWKRYEESFQGFVRSPGKRLPGSCKGRGQRLHPEQREGQCPLTKPSRPGEVSMTSNFLGREVRKWFLQLRRIQSLCHAIRANKSTADAQLYRASLWHAIREARGFQGSFQTWWPLRPTRLQGSPMYVPDTVPSLAVVDLLFEDFQVNYRQLEAWHARRRKEILQLHLEEHTENLFALVRPQPKGALMHLENEKAACIIGVSDDHKMIHVDQELPTGSNVTYLVEGAPASMTKLDDCIYEIQHGEVPEPGQEVVATEHYTTVPEIHQCLENFWKKRWWMEVPPSKEEWTRVLAFGQAYLPKDTFQAKQLNIENWNESNRRYTPKSARGPDGVSRLDLQWMPDELGRQLVGLLRECEDKGKWPEQVYHGFVHPLPKKDASCAPSDFRPVIIYSMIYRSWGSLRSKEFLKAVSKVASHRQFGFMPQSDAAEMWLMVQALVECSVQDQSSLFGFVTDMQKAFENIPRIPIYELVCHMGLDRKIANLWFDFLENTQRWFLVKGEVGQPIYSNRGLPEGDALSCLGMAIIDLTFHAYMQQFSARTQELSFVDNLEVMARSSQELHEAVVCLQTWVAMWDIPLDESKSYTWTSKKQERPGLKILGWRVVQKEKDLGAAISYGSTSTATLQQTRIDALLPLWQALKRITCPEWMKGRVIRQAFWPRAFYGIAVSNLGWEVIKSLRSKAMQTLRMERAGAAPGLRLFCICHEQTDPGFYQFWTVLMTFRRVGLRRPALQAMWRNFMLEYGGQRTYGPFGKLLEVCAQVQWRILPPMLVTADGLHISLLSIEEAELYDIAKDAWAQKVSWEVMRRKDLQGLQGIDEKLFRLSVNKTPGFKKHCINLLRDGSFVDSSRHKKYDLGNTGLCKFCSMEDSIEHRCKDCPFLTDIRQRHQNILRRWDQFTPSLRHHLIPSRNPWLAPFRELLHGETEEEHYMPISLPGTEPLDLFTDGSCWFQKIPEFALGSWAVVDATNDALIQSGPLRGPRQSSDKAELTAIIVALETCGQLSRPITVWTDSSFAAEGLHRILQCKDDIPDGVYETLWIRLQQAVDCCKGRVTVQHISSHRDTMVALGEVDDWTALWNARADHEAAVAQKKRSPEFFRIWNGLTLHRETGERDLGELRELHWEVAEYYVTQNPGYQEPEEEEEESEVSTASLAVNVRHDAVMWLDGIPDDWILRVQGSALHEKFGERFTRQCVEIVTGHAGCDSSVLRRLSWIEIATWFQQEVEVMPVPHHRHKGSWMAATAATTTSQTLAAIVRLLRDFFKELAFCFQLDIPAEMGISLVCLRIFTPLSGTLVRIREARYQEVVKTLLAFTARRPIRRANDLTRPLPR